MTLLIRHFLLVAVKEINYSVSNNNKPYRINYSHETYNQFVNENKAYYKKNNLINDDSTVNILETIKHFDSFHKLIRLFTYDEKLIIMPKLNETNLYELML